MKLSLNLFTTFDGVSQGPGSANEDARNGFTHGGWLMSVFDDDCGRVVEGWFERCGALLLGRRTFDTFASHWPHVTDANDAVAHRINNAHKYVVTSTQLGQIWTDASTVMGADFLADVAKLKSIDDELEQQVHGSIRLARTLHEAGLVDIYRFLMAPVVVGRGARLFDSHGPARALTVQRSTVTANGVWATEMTPHDFTNSMAATVRNGQDVISEA